MHSVPLLLFLVLFVQTSIARPYILFANRKDIRLLEITNNKARAPTNIIVKNLTDAAALDYFLEDSQVCWSEINREVIRCAKIDPYVKGKVVKRTIVSTGLLKPEGLACDWIGKKIYWTDSDTKRIEVTGMSGSESERAVLVWSGLDLPRALSLAPSDGLMFWSDWGHYPKIEVCGMNGDLATRKVIVDNDIVWPNGITLDFETRRLFWLEAKLGYIASVDWDGQKRKTIYGNKQALQQPFAITMSATSLFWTDWDTNSLYSYNISTDQVERLKVRGKLSPMDIRVFEPNRQPQGSSPCNQDNGGCSHLCLAAPYPPSYTCACPTGFKLLNKTTCASRVTAIWVNKTGEQSISSLPEAVRLLQLETIRGLQQTILEKEMTITYMSEVMLHSNQVMEEQENLLKVQADAIQEFNEEVKVGRTCSTLLGAAADRISLQEEAISLLKSSLVTSRNFSELSTSGMDQLDVAPFMMEMLESYNQLAEMVENMKTAMEKDEQVEAQTSELLTHLADLRSALESASINMDTLEQQSKMIEMQGRSIALLTPLLRRSNSSDILWFDNTLRTSRRTGEVGLADVAACSCLPRSASTNQLRPVRVDYQCQADTNRSFQLPCPGGVCSSRELPSCTASLEWDEEEVSFEKCQELSFNGSSVLCGVTGTKETTKRLHIGGGIVEEVFTTSCNDCGDLSAALEWTAWTSCAGDTSGRVIEGMLCRRRGNTYMGFEEEETICAAPWTQLSTGCYRFHESPMTQIEAKKFCEEEQQVPARLVEIDSAEENRAIIDEIKRQNFASRTIEFWLGITDRHSEGHWVLESTGKSVVFTNWNSGEPNNAGLHQQSCAFINSNYTWNDVFCNDSSWLTALCEK